MSGGELSDDELGLRVQSVMGEAWREPGFCVPNRFTYPFQWLWDSCFHSLVWAHLGDDRCVTELENVFACQNEEGFVPHITYWHDPAAHADLWGQSGSSTITQPPMYGHCIAELVRGGYAISDQLARRARAGLTNLVARPKTATGLIPVWHPWETGCDDSARWDDWCDGGFELARWKARKSEIVRSFTKTSAGAVTGSEFAVGSAGFNALVAWNIAELDSVGLSDDQLNSSSFDLVARVVDRWDATLVTWTDADSGSGTIRTLDAALCLLIDPRDDAFDKLIDVNAFGASYGPRGAHIGEPSYDPNQYWRGPAWPQLSYLLWKSASQADHLAASLLGASLVRGVKRSGLAEYWNPETGAALGAKPQTWAGLALLVD